MPKETRRQYKTRWQREHGKRSQIKNKIAPGDGDPRHGRPSSYTNHACRCDDCRTAFRERYRSSDFSEISENSLQSR